MNEYLIFVLSTVAGTLVSVSAYTLLGRRPVPITSRIGIGLLGASVGTFGGMMLVRAFDLDGSQYVVIAVTLFFSIAMSIGFQNSIFKWSQPANDK